MGLQTSVGLYRATAVAGDKATPDQSIYTPINYLAGQNGVKVGTFCWVDGTTANIVNATPVSTEAPLGFVERNLSYPQYNVTADGSLVMGEGQVPNIAVKGDYFVVLKEAATVGGTVYVDKRNGDILAAAGANGISTGWKFATAGQIGDTVIITKWA